MVARKIARGMWEVSIFLRQTTDFLKEEIASPRNFNFSVKFTQNALLASNFAFLEKKIQMRRKFFDSFPAAQNFPPRNKGCRGSDVVAVRQLYLIFLFPSHAALRERWPYNTGRRGRHIRIAPHLLRSASRDL